MIFLFIRIVLNVCPASGNPAPWSGGHCNTTEGVFLLDDNRMGSIASSENGALLYASRGVGLEVTRCSFQNTESDSFSGGVI
jgi:hypothetical protein